MMTLRGGVSDLCHDPAPPMRHALVLFEVVVGMKQVEVVVAQAEVVVVVVVLCLQILLAALLLVHLIHLHMLRLRWLAHNLRMR